MAVTTTNLGVITAYGDAVAAGYTGTKAEWQTLMASYATVGQQAVDAKNDAVAAKNTAVSKATEATTAANTATTKASEASASAQSIAQSASQIAQNTSDISELKEDLSDISDEVKSANLCDPSELEAGLVVTNGEVSTADQSYLGYNSSGFIPVESSKTYCFTTFRKTTGEMSTLRRAYNMYDASKNVVPYSYFNQTNIEKAVITVPVGVSYIRVSAGNGYDLCVTEGSDAPNSYIPFFDSYREMIARLGNVPIEQVKAEIGSDILSGKKWAHCGDSFSYYTNASFDSGPFSGQYKTFPRLISQRRNMTLYSAFFNSGRTLAYPSDGTFHNSLTDPSANCYYQNIPVDTDYITIMLGINDSHHAPGASGGDGEDNTGEIPIGTISDATTATYYGAWNVVLTWLITNRPFAHIGIFVSNGCDAPAYREAQIAIAKKYGVPYIDLNGDERTPVMIRSQNTDIASAIRSAVTQKQAVDYDGTETGSVNLHPNYKAHEYESTFIENFLRST